MHDALTKSDFERLLELRAGLRRFLRWSEQQAQVAGLTPAQHQLLLAVKGHPDRKGPTVGDVADHLMLRPHSASELIGRAEAVGLVQRQPDAQNASVVRVYLTALGEEKLEALAEVHVEEIAHLAPTMAALGRALERAGQLEPHPAARPRGRSLVAR
jgi:DNA-binding MarR family transcriptional regulator